MMKLEKIVILGGGVTGCVVAASLANALANTGIAISVVELADDEREKHQAVTLSPFTQVLHETLGLDEAEILAHTQGTFSLGASFNGWQDGASRFLQTYTTYGVDFHGIEFQHFYTKLKDSGLLEDYHDYSLSSVAALSGKFAHPVRETKSILSTLNYGLNLNAGLYAGVLKEYASMRGVNFQSGEFVSAFLDQTGLVREIVLTSDVLTADLFIDCSGSRALLIGGVLGVENYDRSGEFLNTHCASFARKNADKISSAVSMTVVGNCWVNEIPLQGYTVSEVFFCENYFDKSELDAISVGADVSLRSLTQAYRKSPWQNNVVAFGSAAGTVEPFIFSPIDVLYRNIQAFIRLLPIDICCPLNAKEFNRIVIENYTRLYDYNLCHYRLSSCAADSAYWNACRTVPVSPSIKQRIELFRQCGKVVFHDSEMIPTAAWVSLLMGFGVLPQAYDSRVDGVDCEELRKKIQQIRLITTNTAEKMPYHGDYLRRYLARDRA